MSTPTPELVHDADREQLRQIVRKFVGAKMPITAARQSAELGSAFDPSVWKQMAEELGLQGMAIGEEHGGAGQSFVELAIVMEEFGRALAGGPFLSTVVLAAGALEISGDEAACQRYLPAIAQGTLIATVAVSGVASLQATHRDGAWALSGDAGFVLAGADADVVLLFADTESGISLFAVDAGAEGLQSTPLEVLDMTRPQANLSFADTPAALVGTLGDGARVHTLVLQRACVAIASEQIGGASQVLELAVDYVKQRYQFGRAVASFQAIKHKAADMLVQLEQARSTAIYAAWAVTGAPEDLTIASSLAKLHCSNAFSKLSGDAIQLLGGIGFTWEHDAHLYYKRAASTAQLFGDPGHHRRVLTETLGLTKGANA